MRLIMVSLLVAVVTGVATGQGAGDAAVATGPGAMVPVTSSGEPQVFEGTVTLVDTARGLVVIQERGRAKAVKLDSLPASLRVGERVSIEGRWQAFIAALPGYPDQPSGREALSAFKTPVDWGDHYVARLRGFLRPPADGSYTFWIAADDEGELWLSGDGDPVSAKKIAAVSGSTKPGEWDRHAGQQSQPVSLEAGKGYYVEALHREWRGHDHVAVAWQGPGFERRIIEGTHLSPWRAVGRKTDGILREYWRECYISNLAALSSAASGATMSRVAVARVRFLGKVDLPAPRRIRVNRGWTLERNFLRVVVDGTVTFATTDRRGLTLELADRDERMSVRVLDWGERPVTPLFNRRVRVQGVCEVVMDPGGEPTAGLLWAPAAGHLELLDVAERDGRELEIVPVSELTPQNLGLPWGQKIRVRGTAGEPDAKSGAYLVRGDDSFSAFVSPDGVNWKPVGAPVPVPMGNRILVGVAASSAAGGARVAATFDHLSIAPEASRSAAIGAESTKGMVEIGDASVTIRPASGNDWETADDVHFQYQAMSGEGEIVARLASFSSGRPSDKAGVMMRESLQPNAPHVALVMTQATRVDLRYRAARGATSKRVDRQESQIPQWLKLVRRQNTVVTQLAEGEALVPGKPVELVGTLGWQDGALALMDALERRGRLPPIGEAAARPRDVLIADLPADAAANERFGADGFRVRGVVTFMDRVANRDLLFVQDESGGTLVRVSRAFLDSQRLEPGRRVEVEGVAEFAPDAPRFRLSTATVLGWRAMPRPRPLPDRAETRKTDGHWVEVRGIVRSAKDETMWVMGGEGLLPVWVGGTGVASSLDGRVDSLVTVRGVFSTQLASGPMLLVPSARFIEVREAAPGDPFALPLVPIGPLRSREANPQTMHRTKVSGVVTWCDKRVLSVQDGTGGAWILANESDRPEVGDLVDVVGFAESGGQSLTLVDTLLRGSGQGPLPVPRTMPLDDMLGGRLDATLVRVEGVVLEQRVRDGQQLLDLQSGQRVFEAVLPTDAGRLPSIPAGSRVQVTGVSRLQSATHNRLARSGYDQAAPATLDVLLRGPADVVVLHRPPWWNWRHTAGVFVTLAAILGGSLAWIRMLRRRVDERTRELRDAMGRLQRETEISATLAERDRLAAEIHDTLEQGLSGIMMQLDGVDARLDSDVGGARKLLEMARRMVGFSRGEVRHSLWNLESSLLQSGDLGAALTEIAGQMGAGSAVQVKVEVAGEAHPLPPAVDHHLLRSAQETLNNALKHSGASAIEIRLTYRADSVQLAVTDDGCGFEPDSVLTEAGKSLGLRNLRSRSRKIKARLDIDSRRGKGTTVQLTVPLSAHAGQAAKPPGDAPS